MRKAIAVLSLAALVPGCAAVAGAAIGGAAAVGAYKYFKNHVERDYAANLDRCHDAALRAVENLGLGPAAASKDFQRGTVRARTSDGRVVEVISEYVSATLTRVDVRVGDFETDANRAAAERIHEELARLLEAAA